MELMRGEHHLMKNLEDILLNPVRMRIVQHLSYLQSTTVSRLVELMSDVPRTTLYRHINMLYESGLLTVIKEEKVRGTYEREYALNFEKLKESLAQNPIQESVYTFIMKLLANFESYFKTQSADPIKDRLFLTENALLLSDDEFEQFTEEVFMIVKKYMNFPVEQGRKPRFISIISSPCNTKEDSDVN
jgi:DNA-binding transcriptional ArsR family regulator